MSPKTPRPFGKTETGAVLVVSLMFLVLLTLIGLTGMQITTLEEKMSGNARDRNLAFQAAESALRAGEQTIPALPPPATPPVNGLYRYNDIDTNGTFENDQIWDTLNFWIDTTYSKVAYINSGSLASTIAAPAYIIEEMPFTCDSLDVPCPEYSKNYFYRVTARATGGTTDAVVLVQSLYKR